MDNFITFIISASLLIGYIIFLFRINKINYHVNPKMLIYIRVFQYLSVLLSIGLYFLQQKDYSLTPYWLNKVIYVIPIPLSLIVLVFNKNNLKKIEKNYHYLISSILIFPLTIFTWSPFLGIIIFGYFFSPEGKIYYEDENIKVKKTFNGILQHNVVPDIYEKIGPFLVKRTNNLGCYNFSEEIIVKKVQNQYIISYTNDTVESSHCQLAFNLKN